MKQKYFHVHVNYHIVSIFSLDTVKIIVLSELPEFVDIAEVQSDGAGRGAGRGVDGRAWMYRN